MNFLDALAKSAFGCTTEEAQQKMQCISCKKKVELATLSEVDQREYALSALCSTCYNNLAGDEG